MTHVVMFSGGVGSWAAARRVVDRNGTNNVVLLFADTLTEDEDLYRFIADAALDIGVPITRVADGRTPWEVFRDVRFIGNSRIAQCSRLLKREQCRQWVRAHCVEATIYLGIDWSESHRLDIARKLWAPWQVEAPLCDPPYLARPQVLGLLRDRGIAPPRLYSMGFPHNNCGGFCVRAGQAQFARLLKAFPCRYAYHEMKELELRLYLGKKHTILRETHNGKKQYITLREFRERIQRNEVFDGCDWGGCGCFT